MQAKTKKLRLSQVLPAASSLVLNDRNRRNHLRDPAGTRQPQIHVTIDHKQEKEANMASSGKATTPRAIYKNVYLPENKQAIPDGPPRRFSQLPPQLIQDP